MRFAYWQPPPQGIYHGKTHVALKDGESEAMLCGKRVTSKWTCTSERPEQWLCRTCEHKRTELRKTEIRRALEGDERAKDSDGVPERYHDFRFEYLEGHARGLRGKQIEYPIHDMEAPLEAERKQAWDSGVRAGRKARRGKVEALEKAYA